MSALEQNLLDYLLETDEENLATSNEGFSVDTIEKAEWCMRKLAKLAQDDADDEAMAEREIERIKKWLEERNKPRQQSREFFERHLTSFHQRLLLQDDRMKTVKLPHGALKARKVADKFEYDEKTIVAWAKEQGRAEFIRVKEEVVKDAVKRTIKEDGESVPGVLIVPQGMSFTVEVSR